MHDRQKITVALILVTAFLSYSFYLYSHLPFPQQQVSPAQYEGKLVWQRYNCNACHQVYGLGGYLGPDLTNVYSRRGPAYIEAMIKGGSTVMPGFPLSKGEINALNDYLKAVDSTGSADPRKFNIHYDGTITQ